MKRHSPYALAFDWVWFLACAAASSAWCWTAARELGATFDEPLYVARGLQCWRTGSHRGLLKVGTMPLPVDVETLPLYCWERWHGVALDPVGDLERLLPWARAGNLVFWWVLLTYGWLAGRELAGPWGGRVAVVLLACEPNLLAHATLATTDIAVTACLLALVYHFRTGRQSAWLRRVGLPMLWFAAALLAKASGILFGPLCVCVVQIDHFLRIADNGPQTRGNPIRRGLAALRSPAFRRDFRQILLGGLVLVLLYCGCDWQPEPSLVAWAHGLPEGPGRQVTIWAAEHLRLFSNGLEGLVRQCKHNVRGHDMFLLGEARHRAVWYYFPVALSIKLGLPLLILPTALALLRPRALNNWACAAAATLLAFSLAYRVQIGIRLVLPMVALAVVGLAAAAVRTAKVRHSRARETERGDRPWARRLGISQLRRRMIPALPVLLAGCVVWTAASSVRIWPHGLCFVNEIWGGPEHGYLLLSDSNYDWGQGLKELARWQEKHATGPLAVWYFGTDPAVDRGRLRTATFHFAAREGPETVREQSRGRYLAVSTTLLHGGYTTGLPNTIAFLRSLQPAARTTTFVIYDFTGEGQTQSVALRNPFDAATR